MRSSAQTAGPLKRYWALALIFVVLSVLLLSGCATTGASKSDLIPQEITIEKGLKVKLYTSTEELREAYMYAGGDLGKVKRVKGFYSDLTNTIHCMKWDHYTCGHELFHVLQYKGDHALIAEKGYEHFKGTDFASE
jgi:hypothetical protein